MKKTIKREHHGKTVSVLEKNVGRHRENCLCFNECKFFKPDSPADNCKAAQALFELLKDESNPILVAPVWECEKYDTYDY